MVSALASVVAHALPLLSAIPEDAASKKPAPNKWSKKEILGHLVDSAANNHSRFVRAQFQDDLVFDGYQQDAWVKAGDYQNAPWDDLVALWHTFNLQIARVMEHVPDAIRLRETTRHNFDRIGFNALPPGQPATLDFLMQDYVRHLEHHLRQIFP